MAVMSTRRLDLPLDQAAASRFLPWLIGAAVYLAVIVLGLAAVADDALRAYNLRARLVTITLPSLADASRDSQGVDEALAILRATEGVTSATPVPVAELEALIEPWLGGIKGEFDLPLPRLIDVTLDPAAKPDLPALQERLQKVVVGASIGTEAMSRDRAERMAAYVRAWGSAAGVAVLVGTLIVVAVITRISLRMNGELVELLRCMGAPDQYLARQFERHALNSGVRGGVVGFALAALTVLALLYSGRQMDLTGAVTLNLRLLDWVLLACVPVVAALLVTAVARMTALWGLTRAA